MAEESISFDAAAAYYDTTRRRSPEAAARETEVLAEGLRDCSGRALEIGVGTGQVSIPLHQAGIPMVGLDLSTGMLSVLVGKAGGRPPFPLVNGDATVLPFADDAVGAALFRWVLHLIPRWRDTVAELVRVVRPGGVVFATLGGMGTGPKPEIQRRFAELAGVDRRPPGLDWADFDGLDAEFRRHGAEVGQLEPFEDHDSESVEEYLQHLADNRYSWTWPATDEARRRAAVEVRAWAESEYGPIEDHLSGGTYTVQWHSYRLP